MAFDALWWVTCLFERKKGAMTQERREHRKVLKYLKGEQIIKQGDYGISIYKILSGKVQVFRKSEGVEVPLATLGPGAILGEMAFLSGDAEVRSASAGALEDAELEVWHPRELAKKYEQTSPIIKAITDQAISRLRRINRFMDKLAIATTNEPSEKSPQDSGAWKSKRTFYRKKVYIPCRYAPPTRPKNFPFLKGNITDISMGGMGLQISAKNESVISHEVGESFHIDTVLPNGKDLSLTAQIVSVKKTRDRVRLGMQFKNLPDYQEAKKTLWFFLMPT
jgi:Cyclic nucleotide-binding domain/PilZ domain